MLHSLRVVAALAAFCPLFAGASEISGVACYPTIESLPAAPDMALILVGPELVNDAALWHEQRHHRIHFGRALRHQHHHQPGR